MKPGFAIFLLLSVSAAAAGTNGPYVLVPAYGPMPPTFWEVNGAWILPVGAALLVLAAWAVGNVFRRKPPVVVPPAVLAREALMKLQGRPEDGTVLSEVSQILRRYIGAAFQMRGAELTTAEFTGEISGNGKIGPELAEKISNFLRDCDARKFSPASAPGSFEVVERAHDLINRLEAKASALSPAREVKP